MHGEETVEISVAQKKAALKGYRRCSRIRDLSGRKKDSDGTAGRGHANEQTKKESLGLESTTLGNRQLSRSDGS